MLLVLFGFSTGPRDRLGRTSPKWPMLCHVGSPGKRAVKRVCVCVHAMPACHRTAISVWKPFCSGPHSPALSSIPVKLFPYLQWILKWFITWTALKISDWLIDWLWCQSQQWVLATIEYWRCFLEFHLKRCNTFCHSLHSRVRASVGCSSVFAPPCGLGVALQ